MKILVTPLAKEDLKQIESYIKTILKNPIAADNTKKGIISEISKLENAPNLGSPVLLRFVEIPSLFSMRYANYMIFYRICNQQIIIERICFAKRDFEKLL